MRHGPMLKTYSILRPKNFFNAVCAFVHVQKVRFSVNLGVEQSKLLLAPYSNLLEQL